MGLPVRVVNCGTTIGDREFAGASSDDEDRGEDDDDDDGGDDGEKRIMATEISYTFSARLFHLATPSYQFLRLLNFFRNTWLVRCHLGTLTAR